tara:strand:+ start:1212 stop:1940 length:729 start_codon:yes stop_codon:yes gene_type:complete
MIEKDFNNYSLRVFENKEELFLNLSDLIEIDINQSLNLKDRFKFCICGGSTPKSVYKLLSKKDLFWERVDLFLGDERCVNPNSEDSNTKMIRNSLLNNFGSKALLYEIFKEGNLEENIAKRNLTKQLKNQCDANPISFDLTLLGLGDDGHTASLFPYGINNNIDELVIFSFGKGLKRISLTPKILSLSKKVFFLVCGASKQVALKRLIDLNESSERTPAKLIQPKSQILIFSDLEASKYLPI